MGFAGVRLFLYFEGKKGVLTLLTLYNPRVKYVDTGI